MSKYRTTATIVRAVGFAIGKVGEGVVFVRWLGWEEERRRLEVVGCGRGEVDRLQSEPPAGESCGSLHRRGK